ncbi:MAG: phage terminase large subunit [Methylocystis sp.]|nr:phage terminase large subunit [Methylocystis sp.]
MPLPSLPSLTDIQAELRRREDERRAAAVAKVRKKCASLAGFIREAWHVVEPGCDYKHGWHIDAICQHLEAVTDGRINRLLINVPPGSSKSLIVSVMWPAWEWGPRGLPHLRYLVTSFNEGPIKRDTRKCRDLILSDWYQTHWPEVRLVRTGEKSFANSATGAREGVAFGSLTSQRGDRFILDDPHSTDTAESDAERMTAERRFREGAVNRLNDQERSAIVVIMQRLHEGDISGVIKRLGMPYEHLCLPMEFEEDRWCKTSIGFKDPRTYDGELLDPVRFPPEAVERLKIDMGEYAYAAQYQQRPSPRAGGMIKPDKIEVIEARPARARWVRAWDLAGTKGGGDWTAGVLIGETPDGRVVIGDVIRIQGGPDEVVAAIVGAAKRDGKGVRISIPQDPGQAGKAQAQFLLRKLSGYIASASPESGDKLTRAGPIASQINVGNVMMVDGEWNAAFISEMRLFPFGRHDDQIDAMSRGYSALITDQTAGAFFDQDALLLAGSPLDPPVHCDAVFVTVASNTKTGKPGDAVSAVFWFFDRLASAFPLIVADWEIAQADGDVSGAWLASIMARADELSRAHGARSPVPSAFFDDSGTGAVLLQHAMRLGAASPIESRLTAMGKAERAISISGYVSSGRVKLSRLAFDKVAAFRGLTRNHLIGEIAAFRPGAPDDDLTQDTLLDAFCYGVAIGVGTPEGF